MPMVVSLSYGELVVPTEDAVALMKILERAELYRLKYHNDGATGKSENTHHIFPNDNTYHARLITEDLYRMAKLAGKPEKD